MVICAHSKEIDKQPLQNSAKAVLKVLLTVKSGFVKFGKGCLDSSYILFAEFCKR